MKTQTTTYWTDYPFIALGDVEGKEAPLRPVTILDYDGDKYATVDVCGNIESIKIGYIYHQQGRSGEVPSLKHREAMAYAR